MKVGGVFLCINIQYLFCRMKIDVYLCSREYSIYLQTMFFIRFSFKVVKRVFRLSVKDNRNFLLINIEYCFVRLKTKLTFAPYELISHIPKIVNACFSQQTLSSPLACEGKRFFLCQYSIFVWWYKNKYLPLHRYNTIFHFHLYITSM